MVQTSSGIPDCFITNKNPVNSAKNSGIKSPFDPLKSKFIPKSKNLKPQKLRMSARRNSKNFHQATENCKYFKKNSEIEDSLGEEDPTGNFRRTAYFPQSPE